MSFDVFLVPSTETPPAGAFKSHVLAALKSAGVTAGSNDGEWRTADGRLFDFYVGDEVGGMFELRTFSAGIAAAIFSVADGVRCFVVATSENAGALRTPANSGAAPDDFPSITGVASPNELANALAPNFVGWEDFREQVARPEQPPSRLAGLWARLTKSRKG